MNVPTVRLWTHEVYDGSMHEVLEQCAQVIDHGRAAPDARRPQLVFALNPEKVVRARLDPELERTIDAAGLLIPDGVGVCLASWVLNGRRLRRIAGADLMPQLCELAAQRGYSVFLFGARPEVSERAEQVLRERFPKLEIVGRAHGFGPEEGPDSAIARIVRARPDIVFVALGTPAQERWMARHAPELPVGLMQGVGGTFDVLAGAVRRAPLLMRLSGLEWLYRLLADPRRWRRQLALVTFVRWVALARFRPPAIWSVYRSRRP